MAESNFVDYVKIYCRSGKGGAGSAHLLVRSLLPKVVLTGEMEVEAVM